MCVHKTTVRVQNQKQQCIQTEVTRKVFTLSSSDTYQVLFGLSIVSSDDEPPQKVNL